MGRLGGGGVRVKKSFSYFSAILLVLSAIILVISNLCPNICLGGEIRK